MPGEQQNRQATGFFVALGAVQAIWPLTMDLYLPAFPEIADDLDTAPALLQLTLTGAFIGMAIGQLAAGPLSDRVGRMRPLLVVLALYAVASFACAMAPTIEALIALRFVQGLGAAASSVIVLAIVRDTASGARMVRMLARLQLVNGVFVVASPAIGAQLLRVLDWRGLFAVLVAYGLLLFVAALAVLRGHETNTAERRAARPTLGVLGDYRVLARDGRFRAVVVAGALHWAAMMSYMAASAFLFQGVFHLDATGYAIVFGGHGALMIASAQLGARLAIRRGVAAVLRGGSIVLAAAGIGLLLSVALVPAWGLAGFVVPLLVFTSVFGLLSPSVQSAALHDHGDRAGTAASILGASNMVAGALIAPLVGSLGLGTPLPVAAAMAVAASAAAVVVLVAIRREPAEKLEAQ